MPCVFCVASVRLQDAKDSARCTRLPCNRTASNGTNWMNLVERSAYYRSLLTPLFLSTSSIHPASCTQIALLTRYVTFTPTQIYSSEDDAYVLAMIRKSHVLRKHYREKKSKKSVRGVKRWKNNRLSTKKMQNEKGNMNIKAKMKRHYIRNTITLGKQEAMKIIRLWDLNVDTIKEEGADIFLERAVLEC